MSASDRDRWNEKYAQRQPLANVEPDEWLVDACAMINRLSSDQAAAGRAVDLACGLGHNSVWLAQQGWAVDGIDISAAGLTLARQVAGQTGAEVNWIEADLDDWQPAANSYDLAVIFRFLDRESVPRAVNAGLRPGGLLIYETFAAGQLERVDSHIRNPAFTLAPGELPRLFQEFDVIEYREAVLEDRTVQRMLARRQ